MFKITFYIICSFFKLCVAALVKKKPLKQDTYIIGSAYGNGIDPNASALIKFLISLKLMVIYVGEGDLEKSNFLIRTKRGGFKSYLLFFTSKACFYTHSLSDVIPFGHRLYFLFKVMRIPKMIFLQHGVIGLKKKLSNGVDLNKYLNSLEPTFDKMVVSTVEEKSIIADMGIDIKKIALVGLPRFDSYFSVSKKEKKKVLIFFTWQPFEVFNKKLDEINEAGVIDLFENAFYEVVLSAHPMQKIPNKNKRHFIKQQYIEREICQSALLITDDSSLAWDMFYMNREVLFYKPSNQWFSNHKSLELRKCENAGVLLKKSKKILINGNLDNFDPFINLRSQRNCERVFLLTKDSN